MKLIDVLGITLPEKNNETFRKIELETLYHFDFKHHQAIASSVAGVIETQTPFSSSKNIVWNIAQQLNNTQEVLSINKSLKEPLVLIYEMKEDETLYSNQLKIEVKKGIKATIIEIVKSQKKESAFIFNREISLEENASLEYVKIQEIEENNSVIYNVMLHQKEASSCQMHAFEKGEGFVIDSYDNAIDEKNVHYTLNGLVTLQKEAYVANIIQTIHNNEHSMSHINIKHTLKDKSTAIFKAKSIVNENALYTKAFQNAHTILLSNNATIIAQPHLEISIDELEASHGTTTGTLDEEQLLYLQARGISKEFAQTLLLNAFEAQMYEAIENEYLKEYVKTHLGVSYV